MYRSTVVCAVVAVMNSLVLHSYARKVPICPLALVSWMQSCTCKQHYDLSQSYQVADIDGSLASQQDCSTWAAKCLNMILPALRCSLGVLVLVTCYLPQLLRVIRKTYSSDAAESMLRLACKVFECDMACCTLLTGDAYHVLAGAGILRPGICPDRWGFCAWSFLNSNHELVVVEDTKNDIR